MQTSEKHIKRKRRQQRVRAKVTGTAKRPRLSVFRSNTQLVLQLIDDASSTTLASVYSSKVAGKTPQERAKAAGAEIAKQAKEKKISEIVFDRGGYQYIGNIKVVAEAAREAGLKF